MKAKLIKVDGTGYYNLENERGTLIGTTFEFKTHVGDNLYSLSFKNCEAIANGYDLDELAEECAETAHTMDELYENGLFYGFMSGFQKALEILGDKKFTYNQMVSAITESSISHRLPSLIIQDLQQTEWDVTIKMKSENVRYDGGKQIEYDVVPLLDADGCLILKRKSE